MRFYLAQYKEKRTVDVLKRAYQVYDPRISHVFSRRTSDMQKVIAKALTELTGTEYKYFYMMPFE